MTLTQVIIGFSVGANVVTVAKFAGNRLLGWYKERRNRDIERAFIRDMASNHLPHLYHALRLICDKLEIEWSEPPIRFVELNGKDDHAS